jgi:CRP-like cAMP-binding protein
MISTDALEVLRTTSLFAGFTDEQLEVVPKVGRVRNFTKGDRIVELGATGSASLWLVLEGEVDVLVGGHHHRSLGPGNHFGEMALLTEAPRSADVVANQPTVALEFSRRHLEGLIGANPQVAIDMLAELARRLREATEALADVIRSSETAAAEARKLGLQSTEGPLPHLGPIDCAVQRPDDH